MALGNEGDGVEIDLLYRNCGEEDKTTSLPPPAPPPPFDVVLSREDKRRFNIINCVYLILSLLSGTVREDSLFTCTLHGTCTPSPPSNHKVALRRVLTLCRVSISISDHFSVNEFHKQPATIGGELS